MGSPYAAVSSLMPKSLDPAGSGSKLKIKGKGKIKGGLLQVAKDTGMKQAGLIDKADEIAGKSPLGFLAKANSNNSAEEVAKEVTSNSSDLFKKFSQTERMKSAAKENSNIAEAMNLLSGYLGK